MTPAGRTSEKHGAAILTFTRTQALTESLKQFATPESIHNNELLPFEPSNQIYNICSMDAVFIEIDKPSAVNESLTLLKKIRTISHHSDIFMLHTQPKSLPALKYYLAGADYFIKMPTDQVAKDILLRSTLRDYFWKKTLKLKLDRTRLILDAGDNKIDISYTEMTLIDALMNAPKYVMSQNEIAKALHANVQYYDPRALEKTISRLRTKIRNAYNVELIHSVRGFGYRICRGIVT